MSTRINRDTFLADLNAVRGGLSQREFTEQSSCFAFKDGWVMTFNDEVACRKKIQAKTIEGAVPATRLIDILEKMSEIELDVTSAEGQLKFRGKSKGFSVTKEKEIVLPIDQVDAPGKWHDLPPDFAEALGKVKCCISGDETKFLITCVHLHPEYIEATDNKQLMRYKMDLGLKKSVLVRGKALDEIVTLGMDCISVTDNWVHFKKDDKEGKETLIYSCRKYLEPFPDLDPLLKMKGRKTIIPKGLMETSERAGVFADDSSSGEPFVMVTMGDNRLKMESEGNSGRYWEKRRIKYDGPPISFIIHPKLIGEIADKHTRVRVSENLLKAVKGPSVYIARLGRIDEAEDEVEEPIKEARKKTTKKTDK